MELCKYLGSPRLYLKGHQGKAIGVWGSPHTFTHYPGQQWVRLYLSSLGLHDGRKVSLSSTLALATAILLNKNLPVRFSKIVGKN